jgi:hypothetical protein
MQDSIASLPDQSGEDLDPANLQMLQQTMGHRDMQDPRQQAVLRQEQQRLQQVQAQQQFTQRLEQRLNPRIGTQEDSDPQALQQFQKAQFMARLMGQMKQRYPGMQPPMVPGY